MKTSPPGLVRCHEDSVNFLDLGGDRPVNSGNQSSVDWSASFSSRSTAIGSPCDEWPTSFENQSLLVVNHLGLDPPTSTECPGTVICPSSFEEEPPSVCDVKIISERLEATSNDEMPTIKLFTDMNTNNNTSMNSICDPPLQSCHRPGRGRGRGRGRPLGSRGSKSRDGLMGLDETTSGIASTGSGRGRRSTGRRPTGVGRPRKSLNFSESYGTMSGTGVVETFQRGLGRGSRRGSRRGRAKCFSSGFEEVALTMQQPDSNPVSNPICDNSDDDFPQLVIDVPMLQ